MLGAQCATNVLRTQPTGDVEYGDSQIKPLGDPYSYACLDEVAGGCYSASLAILSASSHQDVALNFTDCGSSNE